MKGEVEQNATSTQLSRRKLNVKHSKYNPVARSFKYNSMKGPNEIAKLSEPFT